MNKQFDSGLVWLRRDLRLDDNAALHLALTHCRKVHCAFVFDRAILDPLPRADRRVEFIRESLVELDQALREASGDPHCGLLVRHGQALDEIVALARELGVQSVFAAHDYEPSAIERDRMVFGALAHAGIALHTVKDHVVFERRELLTRTGTPYTVFTPYKKAWLALVNEQQLQSHDITPHTPALAARAQAMRRPVPTLQEIGFAPSNLRALKITPGISGARALFADFFERMDQYHETRDYPSIKGPSYLGVHLRFGTVSIRRLAAAALQASMTGSAGAAVWLSELVWREFYFQILANFPHVAQSAFKPEFDKIRWRHGAAADKLFQAWCDGRTGYPLVDAAMAQINQTGYMHNRLRMVAGSFLVKDLGIDWRPPAAAMRSPGSASSIHCARARISIRKAVSSRVICRSSRRCPPAQSMRPGKAARWSWPLPTSAWGRTIRSPWSTTTPRGHRRWSVTRWCARSAPTPAPRPVRADEAERGPPAARRQARLAGSISRAQ